MKSVKRQSRGTIARFKVLTIALYKAINIFVSEETVPGTGNNHPAFLKGHILFGFLIQDFFEIWEPICALDEQSIDSTHPEFNQLIHQYRLTHKDAYRRCK